MPDNIFRATVPARLLAAETDDNRPFRVRALVSAYDVKYRIGWALFHTITAGAFKASLAEQPAIPLFWMHAWDWSEQMPVGDGQGEEDTAEGGLVIDGDLYADLDPEVARLHRSTKNQAIREWSIGYSVIASRKDPDDEMHEIVTEAELLEASLVLRGANPDTKTLEVAGVAGPGAASRTRITTPGGVVVETADPDLIARLTASEPPAPGETETVEESTTDLDPTGLLARSKVREMFAGTALGD